MNTFAVSGREGTRLAGASLSRSLVVVVPIALATAIAMSSAEVVTGCVALSVVVVAVARRSPRPVRLEQMKSWRRAGAGRFAIWAGATTEAIILGWVGTLVGAAVVLAPMEATVGRLEWRPYAVLVQLGLVTLAACLPTISARRPSMPRRIASATGLGISLIVAFAALLFAFSVAVSLNNDFDLAIGGFLVLVCLTVATFVIGSALTTGATRLLEHLPATRSVSALCERRAFPTTVRLVVAASIVVVAGTAVLGASVEARPESDRAFDRELARLPVLPANTAILSLDVSWDGTTPLTPYNTEQAGRAKVTPELQRAVRRAVPGAEIIPLHFVSETWGLCFFSCSIPEIVEEPRLREIYGNDASYSKNDYESFSDSDEPPALPAFTRVAPRKELQRAYVERGEVPAFSFNDVTFAEVPRSALAGVGQGRLLGLVLRARRPLTDADMARLTKVVQDTKVPDLATLKLVGPNGQITPTPTESPSFGGTASLRDQPWATTDATSRWWQAVGAALLALAALVTALTIDTLDRRDDSDRLERAGATPTQIRGALALRAALLVAIVTWTGVLLTSVVVRAGVRAFSNRSPQIPIPFELPWPVVLFLTIGLPLLAAGLAALVARPARAGTVSA